jgi:acetyl-CoA/propionyl-CoA carboxylase biotin carboxyl carrier protein
MPFHKAIMASEQWKNAETCRDLIEDQEWLKSLAQPAPEPADEEGETEERTYTVEVSGKRFEVKVHGEAFAPAAGTVPAANGSAGGRKAPKRGARKSGGGGGGGADELTSPLQGNMWKVLVSEGDTVEEGQLICIIEAMKMENEITAHKAGKIASLAAKEGEPIKSGDPIATIVADGGGATDDAAEAAEAA